MNPQLKNNCDDLRQVSDWTGLTSDGVEYFCWLENFWSHVGATSGYDETFIDNDEDKLQIEQ